MDTSETRQYDAFISYASKDVKQARALEKLLRDNGKKVWRDERNMRPGENVYDSVAAALHEAAAVVTIWSGNSAKSDWVRMETDYAIIARKTMALCLKPFDFRSLPEASRPIHCSDFAETLADPGRLFERLETLAAFRSERDAKWIDISRLPTTYAEELFGREAEMALLHEAWASRGPEKTNIVVFDAMGGIGKTALIHHFVDRMAGYGWWGADAVYVWSFYSQGADDKGRGSAEPFLDAALTWFGGDGTPLPTQHDKGVRLAELVVKRRTLLVLDGLEPLQYPAGRSGGGKGMLGVAGALKEPGLVALFKQLAVRNPGLLVVTTRLRIPELKSFEAPKVIKHAVVAIATEPGVVLLESLGVRGSRAELQAAVKDFRGHALALTNLGRYLAIHFGGDVRRRNTVPIVAQVEDREERDPFRVMSAYDTLFRRQIREQKERGQTASETAAAKQLALLFLVGLFDRPVERAALEALLAPPPIEGLTDEVVGVTRRQWETAVHNLRDMGLLAPKAHGGQDELDAHPLVREFFGERLSKAHKKAWKEAHLRLWQHYRALSKPDPQDIHDLMIVAYAVTHAALAGDPKAAYAYYIKKIKPKIRVQGLYPFSISVLLNFFEEPWHQVSAGLADNHRSNVLTEAMDSLRSSGRLAEAVEAIETNGPILIRQGKWGFYVDEHVELIRILIKLGRLQSAIAAAKSVLEVAHTHNIAWHEADLQCYLGHAWHMAGNLKEAERAFNASTTAAKAGDRQPRLSSFRQFAINEFHLDRGQKKVVYTWTRRTLEAARNDVPTRGVRAYALDGLSMGRLHLLNGQHDQAWQYIDGSIIELRNNNLLDDLPHALVLRAIYYRETAHPDRAHVDLREALDISEQFGMRLSHVDASLEAARLELATGVSVFDDPDYDYLKVAKTDLNETGYERRRPELESLIQELGSKRKQAPATPRQLAVPSVVSAKPPSLLVRLFGRGKRD